MSYAIYHNMLGNKIQRMDGERMEMIYESEEDYRTQTDSDTNRQKPLQSTGIEYVRMRRYRSVTVCLVLLCVFLLTAVIVLCVKNTNLLKIETEKLHDRLTEQDQCPKKPKWITHKLSSYYISSEWKNWSESRQDCLQRGADLLIINDKEEQDFITQFTNGNLVWIGLTLHKEEGLWKWVDGTNLTFLTERMKSERVEMTVDIYESADTVRDHDLKTDINTQQPLQLTESERVRMRSFRSVTVCLVLLCVLLLTAVIVLCVLINTNNQQLITKIHNLTKERDELTAKYNNTTKLCEQLKRNDVLKYLQDGWIYYQSSLYFISSEKKSWSESRRYCRKKGADLIIINNEEEQDFVRKISDEDNIWIGLSDSDVEGRWKWVDGSTLISRFWESAEPDGERKENCALSYKSWWYDYPCHRAYKWICEKRLFTKKPC